MGMGMATRGAGRARERPHRATAPRTGPWAAWIVSSILA